MVGKSVSGTRGRDAASGADDLIRASSVVGVAAPRPLWPEFLVGQPERPVRVLLIDDDPHVRRVIAQELLADERVDLIGQADGYREGKRLIDQKEHDVMLVDLHLGDGTGFDLIRYLKSVRPMTEAVVVSAMEDVHHALHAFELGATGYLVKHSWFGNFPQAVLQVVNGGASITPNLARRLLARFDDGGARGERLERSRPEGAGHGEGISQRERHVLKLIATGLTSPEIAAQLEISVQTVNTHIRNVYQKLGVHTRAQAVSQATRRGLL